MASFRQSLRVVPDESFGSKLRARRFAEGLSQAELAAQFGVRQQTLGAWERGERPQARFLPALAEYVGLPDEHALRALLDAEGVGMRENPEAHRTPPANYTQQRAVEAFAKIVESYADVRKRGDALTRDELSILQTSIEALNRLTEPDA